MSSITNSFLEIEMATEKQRSTFISYSRINREFALKLAKELKAEGFSVWLDQLDIPTGARWDDEIEKALRSSGIFLAVLTPSFVESENAKDEIGYAIDHGKRILPVLLHECEIPLRMRRFQYVDFTRLNYKEGITQAKQLLAKLVKEESMPVSPRSPKDRVSGEAGLASTKEKPTHPVRTRSKPLPVREVSAEPVRKPWTKFGVTFTGIALFVILLLTGGVIWSRGMYPFVQPSPTITPTPPLAATRTLTPTQIPDTPTPPLARFFIEEFNQPDLWDQNWSAEIKHGNRSRSVFSIANGEVNWSLNDEYLWAYYIYQPYTYAEVQIDVEFKNLTGPAGSYLSLICRYNADGWYEFNIYGGQYEIVRRGAAREELSKRPGGMSGYKFGTDVVNRVTAICRDDEISMYANNGNPHPFQLGSNENLAEGQVGIALISDQDWPVSVQILTIRIRQP